MKKEIVSVMMAACLFASLATGCGTANESETSSKSGSEAAGAVSKSGETTTDGERADLVLGATTGFFGAEVWTLRITGMAGSCPSMESAKICTVWMKILSRSMDRRIGRDTG